MRGIRAWARLLGQGTRRSLAAKRGRGEATNRTQYGLARDGAGFVRCPLAWPVVKRILRARVDGQTCASIAADFSADGVPTPTGSGQWHAAGIAGLARNPLILAAAS